MMTMAGINGEQQGQKVFATPLLERCSEELNTRHDYHGR
jgi:hypothetical protein